MNGHPESIDVNASVGDAGRQLAATQASDLMVIAEDGSFAGVVSEVHLLRAVLPDREAVLAAGGSVRDGFDAFERKAEHIAARSIAPYIVTEPVALHPAAHVAAAAAALVDCRLRRLPVVENGRLVGVISASDICGAALGQRESS
jgi:CBS domain-containing protein